MTVLKNTRFGAHCRALAAGVALAVAGSSVALAAPPTKITPEEAEESRQSARNDAAGDLDAGNFASAGYNFDVAAGEMGDPVLFLEAADAYISQGEQDRSIEMAETAIDRAKIALDILYFLDDDDQYKATRYHVLSEGDVDTNIGRANDTVSKAESLIEEIEAEQAAANEKPEGPVDTPKERKPIKPGTGLVIGGSVSLVVGLGGIGMMAAYLAVGGGVQSQVDALDPGNEMDVAEYERLDAQGRQTNILAGVGAGIGGVGLILGGVLIGLGAKKMKDAGGGKEKASAMVIPTTNGLAVVGRF